MARTSLKWHILYLVRRKTLLHQSIWMPFRAASPYTVQDAVDCYTYRMVCWCMFSKRVEIFLLPNLVMGRGEFVHTLLCAMPLVAKLYYISQSREPKPQNIPPRACSEWIFAFIMCRKGKSIPYSITEHRVPKLVLVPRSQPAGDVSPEVIT